MGLRGFPTRVLKRPCGIFRVDLRVGCTFVAQARLRSLFGPKYHCENDLTPLFFVGASSFLLQSFTYEGDRLQAFFSESNKLSTVMEVPSSADDPDPSCTYVHLCTGICI